jgi:hypothetical protein
MFYSQRGCGMMLIKHNGLKNTHKKLQRAVDEYLGGLDSADIKRVV